MPMFVIQHAKQLSCQSKSQPVVIPLNEMSVSTPNVCQAIRPREDHYVTRDGRQFSFAFVLACDMRYWKKHPFAVMESSHKPLDLDAGGTPMAATRDPQVIRPAN